MEIKGHTASIAPKANGQFGVYCLECSHVAQDYTFCQFLIEQALPRSVATYGHERPSDFDPDVSLRTLRKAIANYDGHDDEAQLGEATLLAMVVGTLNALDVHLSTGGRLPLPWRTRSDVV